MVLETYMKLYLTEPDFWGKKCCPKNWENEPKMCQIWSYICSIMKFCIICCVPAQIPYLRKLLFLKYWPKCSQPIRLQDFLINDISRKNQ